MGGISCRISNSPLSFSATTANKDLILSVERNRRTEDFPSLHFIDILQDIGSDAAEKQHTTNVRQRQLSHIE